LTKKNPKPTLPPGSRRDGDRNIIVSSNHVYLADSFPDTIANAYVGQEWNVMANLKKDENEIQLACHGIRQQLVSNVLVDMETYDFFSFCILNDIAHYEAIRIVSDVTSPDYYGKYLKEIDVTKELSKQLKDMFFKDLDHVDLSKVKKLSEFVVDQIVTKLKSDTNLMHQFSKLVRKSMLKYELKHFIHSLVAKVGFKVEFSDGEPPRKKQKQ